jgi:hypothetical protein
MGDVLTRPHCVLADRLLGCLTLLFALAVAPLSVGAASDSVALPRATVEVPRASGSGQTIAVPKGGNLQAALERAQPGDVITLEPGAIYLGPFTLPKKAGDGWITVRTDTPDEKLPSGRRVGPHDAALMPKVVAPAAAAISNAAGAHHYRFVGIEIRPRVETFVVNLVDLGSEARSLDDLPHHIVFDRCYLHGDPVKGGRRGIALNGREVAVVDSYLSDFKERGADSQAVAMWNGAGPIKIVNNHVEAAGENLMFGGADPRIADLVPSDIEIRHNHFIKPLGWKAGEPGFEGSPWTVKNLFELKNARRVLIKDNLFENNWRQAQNGFAILFTVRNQEGRAPWSTVEDVTFADNVVRHVGAGINVLGRDDIRTSQPMRRVVIRNNLFEDVDGSRWGGPGTLFQLLNGAAAVTIEHNTAFQTGSIIVAEGAPLEGFAYRYNITPHNAHGITGTGTGPGTATLDRYFPGAVFEGNVIVGGSPGRYPRHNFFPSSLDDVGFAGNERGRYHLGESSRYRGKADGGDPGIDLRALAPAQAAATSPTP